MLFNSAGFVFVFLPLVLAGYYAMLRFRLQRWIFVYLVLTSLAFYSVWNPSYTLLLLASVAVNYLFGLWIERRREAGRSTGRVMALGILGNVAALGWFKYANFFADNLNALTGGDFVLDRIILPLAISFYTFQQIAYLVDIARGEVRSGGFARYVTFVIFFPQLIAGPIVHYRDMMPQFFGHALGRFPVQNILVGLVIFAIGLFKKTVIADSAAGFSSPVFDAVAAGGSVGPLEAWKAAICYTFQLYFDFSGYSDMAVGLARMFGIVLMANFHAPLRAASIIDYWRRWHMTLQQFIVSYMYQPLVLPLARLAAARRMGRWATFWLTVALPTVVIFVVIGLWHGAAWTFVLFGAMHGVYLATNEFWRALRRKARRKAPPGVWSKAAYHALTLFAVVIANVMFRAESVADAVTIWGGMLDLRGLAALPALLPAILPATPAEVLTEPFVFGLVIVALIALAPNTQQFMGRYRPVLEWHRWREVAPPVLALQWRPTAAWAVVTGVILFLGITFIMRAQSEFIYFNF